MKNPFFKITSIFILLLVPFAFFLVFISIIFMLYTKSNEYLLSLIFMPIGILLLWFSINRIIKINKSFKKVIIEILDKNHATIISFKYTTEEWNIFVKKKYDNKVKLFLVLSFILNSIFIAFLITIYIYENKELFIMLCFITLLLLIPFYLKFFVDLNAIKKNIHLIKPIITVTSNGVFINKELDISYNNQDGLFKECWSEKKQNIKTLIINIKRHRRYIQQYTILIPQNIDEDIENIVNKINNGCIVYKTNKNYG